MIKQSSKNVQENLRSAADKKKVEILSRFFKTKKGEYGYGDVFIGVVVPEQRKIAKKFKDLPFKEIEKLLESKIHEERLTALIILVNQYKTGDEISRAQIFKFYLKNISRVNNWDLVDLSCRDILGEYLVFHPAEQKIIFGLAKSENIWDRRIAIVSSWAFIKRKRFDLTLRLVKMFFNDSHDLMHKASGWMLREIGKQDERILKEFLNKSASKMPRVMLRYAIERFSKKDKKKFLAIQS